MSSEGLCRNFPATSQLSDLSKLVSWGLRLLLCYMTGRLGVTREVPRIAGRSVRSLCPHCCTCARQLCPRPLCCTRMRQLCPPLHVCAPALTPPPLLYARASALLPTSRPTPLHVCAPALTPRQ